MYSQQGSDERNCLLLLASEHDEGEGRNLIQSALEIALKNIASDLQIEDSSRDESENATFLELDRDTERTCLSFSKPGYFKQILNKIQKCLHICS